MLGLPNPASSISTSRTFGEPSGGRACPMRFQSGCDPSSVLLVTPWNEGLRIGSLVRSGSLIRFLPSICPASAARRPGEVRGQNAGECPAVSPIRFVGQQGLPRCRFCRHDLVLGPPKFRSGSQLAAHPVARPTDLPTTKCPAGRAAHHPVGMKSGLSSSSKREALTAGLIGMPPAGQVPLSYDAAAACRSPHHPGTTPGRV